MRNLKHILYLVLVLSYGLAAQSDWTHKVRIAGNPLSGKEIDSIIKSAVESNVFGIEVDNDITGRYESFLDPTVKLEEIRRVTEEAHKVNNKTFVYIAGLECITPDADSKQHTFFKDHPDWVQRDINGRPAIFGSNDAFWIAEGDEDVWISPYAKEWRELYMQRVREIAETGIDGIYVDIPYWMTHFTGWENTWASFDDYTVEAFRIKTGLNAKKDIKLGDLNDPGFIKWINFRMETLTEFMDEIDQTIKEVNPECMTIAEIYPGIGEEVVRVGADVYQIYNVVDVIGHEYSEGEYYASDRAASDWYNYIIGMHTFRAFAEDKASWMLSYSWYDNKNVNPADAMKSLFVSQLFSGTNMWDVKGYVMSSTNDMKTRSEVYKWTAGVEDIFYSKRTPLKPIGVYFSDVTRNYFSSEFINSYRGILNLLIHSHIPFEIVTPRSLAKSDPAILIMPDVKCISNEELETLKELQNKGSRLVLTGEFGVYNEKREVRDANMRGIKGSSENTLYLKECPGKGYSELIAQELNDYFNSGSQPVKLNDFKAKFISELKSFSSYKPDYIIDAPLDLIITSNITAEKVYLFLVNVKGLCEACTSGNKHLKDIGISLDASLGIKDIYALPFLGDRIQLKSEDDKGRIKIIVPEVDKGTVVILERK